MVDRQDAQIGSAARKPRKPQYVVTSRSQQEGRVMSAACRWSTMAVVLGCLVGGAVGAGLAVLCGPESGRLPRARRRERAASERIPDDDESKDLAGRAEEVMEGEGGRTGR
jgi:hypothetical protein